MTLCSTLLFIIQYLALPLSSHSQTLPPSEAPAPWTISDTFLHSAHGDASYGTAAYVTVDGSDGEGKIHGLLRFSPLSIPPNETLLSATLRLRTTYAAFGPVHGYRFTQEWTEQSTWNSLSADFATLDQTEEASFT